MCCCNNGPEFRFVDEDGGEVPWEGYLDDDTYYDVLSVRLEYGYEEDRVTFVLRRKDDASS
jgi:hypothetical protein